jgi:L-lactate dehydrogenase complex protein LldF
VIGEPPKDLAFGQGALVANSGKRPSLPREQQPQGAVTKRGRRVNQDEAAARFIASPEHERMHDKNVWEIRKHRDHARDGVAEWEELRELASQIKQHTLANIDRYLIQFEAAAQANGVRVHWAAGAAEHNRIVGDILRANLDFSNISVHRGRESEKDVVLQQFL